MITPIQIHKLTRLAQSKPKFTQKGEARGLTFLNSKSLILSEELCL